MIGPRLLNSHGSPRCPGTGMYLPVRLLWNRYTLELSLLAAGYLFYISVKRLFVEDIEVVAFDNARRVIDLEIALQFFWEPGIQSWLLEHLHGAVVFFSWVYTLAFFPILIPAAAILFIFRYQTYIFYRNIFLISYAITWMLYLTVPTAPPRMMVEHGFVDTIGTIGPSLYNSKEAIALYNQYSAMPSMHFGWSLLFGIVFLKSRYLPLRLFGIIYPGLSLGAIVVTGNHYILDAIVGGAIILFSYGIYVLIQRRTLSPVVQLVSSVTRAGLRRAYGPLRLTRNNRPELAGEGVFSSDSQDSFSRPSRPI